MAANTIVLPKRSEVKVEECWDLASLFASEQEWEKGLKQWEKMIPGYARFKGKLARSAKMLADCLAFDAEISRLADRVVRYAFLREAEDQANSDAVRMKGRAMHLATATNEAASYRPPGDHRHPAGEAARRCSRAPC